MYASYFGLKREPFSIAPDPRYLFMSERHREALAHLLYGVGGGGGFVLLTGEIGAGKTTVCRCFLEQIPRRCNVAYIFNPKLTVMELLHSICEEFRIPVDRLDPATSSAKAYLDRLNEFLLRTHAVGQNNVLIIDEAQNLSSDVLEQLRLLTNLETSDRKLLQIMLIGQPELRDMLARPELEQLAQRVIARFHLDALSEAETDQYIQHRLAVAGLKQGQLFDAAAVHRVHQATRGVPRRINLLCDRALLGAYAKGQPRVTEDIVAQAAKEVFDLDMPGRQKANKRAATHGATQAPTTKTALPWLVGGGVATAALLGAVWFSGFGLNASPKTEAPKNQVATSGSSPAALAASAALTGASASATTVKEGSAEVAAPIAFDWAQGFETAWRDKGQAWSALARHWDVAVTEANACNQVTLQGLACFDSKDGLALIQALNRPGVLTLFDPQGRVAYGLLKGLKTTDKGTTAQVQIGATTYDLSLSEVSRMWRGDFGTLWRPPELYKGKITEGQSGPQVDWLAEQLAVVQQEPAPGPKQKMDARLKARVHAFQLAQGLTPDGVAGTTTFMQLNRALGISEPTLRGNHVVHP